MSHEKNPVDDNSQALGTGAAAVAGAVTGAAVGAPGGPVGMAIGAVAGGVIGAGAGGSMARTASVEDYHAHLLREQPSAGYYRPGQERSYYESAYDFAFNQFPEYRGAAFAEAEPGLRKAWDEERVGRPENPAWDEARAAIMRGWEYLREQAREDAAKA